MRPRLPFIASLLAPLLLACSPGPATPGGAADAGAPVAFAWIRIDPADLSHEMGQDDLWTQDYRAFGQPAAGGGEIEVPATFTFSDDEIGAFHSGKFTPTRVRGGKGTVTAHAFGFTATTSLTLDIHADFANDGLSADMIQPVLDATTDAALAPAWAYPFDGAVLPPNLPGVDFSWTPAPSTDAFLLHFRGKGGAVRVLTRQTDLVLSSVLQDRVVSLLGPGALTASVFGFASADPKSAGVAQRRFQLSFGHLSGAMYYWSSQGGYAPIAPGEDQIARGYYRFDFDGAIPDGKKAELFLGFGRAGDTCVGCHAISPSGELFATSFATSLGDHFGGDTNWATFDVKESGGPVPWTNGGPADPAALGTFSAITLDNAYLLACDHNVIRAFDLHSYMTHEVATLTSSYPMSHIVTSPTDPTTVLFVEDLVGGGGAHVGRGRIVEVQWDGKGKVFSSRRVVAEDASASLYYPTISPDGNWLVYDRATSGDSFNNPAAELWARPLDGSGAAIPLDAANEGPMRGNSWPRFAPFIADDGEGHPRYFLTFSSMRPHGAQSGVPQLWLSTFDPTTHGDSDPSTPALWIPVQSDNRHNHCAQWAEKSFGH